ncbi:hypothetical protein EVA_10517 [gut metagenome]|uniref:Uncharacterized protein n=1 Tax=gut metagenome TaxID=749906 RepID=J9G2C8_9ZZZZ
MHQTRSFAMPVRLHGSGFGLDKVDIEFRYYLLILFACNNQ